MEQGTAMDWPSLLINAATLVAALAAVYFSHRTLKVQSKQKLAEFRKEWIEDLRSHMAEFRAAVYKRKTAKKFFETFNKKSDSNSKDNAFKWAEKYTDFTEAMGRHYSHVRLALNEEEKEHNDFIELLDLYKDDKSDEIEKHPKKFNELARSVLKKEWDRLKSELN